jgi:hypothetical protein
MRTVAGLLFAVVLIAGCGRGDSESLGAYWMTTTTELSDSPGASRLSTADRTSYYPKYGQAHEHECDLPDAPSDTLYTRGVQTKTSGMGNAYKEFNWSNPNSGEEWTRYEMEDNSPLEACSQYWLDRAVTNTTTPSAATPTTTVAATTAVYESVGKQNAREKAAHYLELMAFSRSGLIDQLEYEGFTTTEAEYGVDAQGANWNAQAALQAAHYLELMAFSRSGLIDQLEYEGFTTTQAEYGVDAVGY